MGRSRRRASIEQFGYATIAATATEVALLRQEQDLRAQVWRVKRDLRKTNKALAEARGTVETATATSATLAAEVAELRAEEAQLRAEVANLHATPAPTRPIVEAWVAVLIALAMGLLAAGVLKKLLARPPHAETVAGTTPA